MLPTCSLCVCQTTCNIPPPTLCTADVSVCSTVCAKEEDISQCVSSAVEGYKAWNGLTCHHRAKVLLKYAGSHKPEPLHLCFWLLSPFEQHCSITKPLFVLLRMVAVLGQHGQCVSELSDMCEASSSSTLVRLLQYYSSWAQLRDILIPNWTPVGEETNPGS